MPPKCKNSLYHKNLRHQRKLLVMPLLLSEIPSGMCAKLRTVAASNNRDHDHNLSYCCLLAPRIYIFVLRGHPVRGESHNQRNTTGEVATTSPYFCNEPHRSHVLCVKADICTTSTSWSQHHFVAVSFTVVHKHELCI